MRAAADAAARRLAQAPVKPYTSAEAASILGISEERLANLDGFGWGPRRIQLPDHSRAYGRGDLAEWMADAARFVYPPNERGERVYFALCVGTTHIKIGRTTGRPEKRIGKFQNSAPVELMLAIPGGGAEERKLHGEFGSLRTHGEWFRAGSELTDFIRFGRTAWVDSP